MSLRKHLFCTGSSLYSECMHTAMHAQHEYIVHCSMRFGHPRYLDHFFKGLDFRALEQFCQVRCSSVCFKIIVRSSSQIHVGPGIAGCTLNSD